MKNINVYYGPKVSFEQILPKRIPITTLTQLVVKHDAKRKEYVHIHKIEGQDQGELVEEDQEEIKCLVAYSEEYAGISEHAIQSFVTFISQYKIGKLYLQNPPLNIVQQFEKINAKMITQRHQYECINPAVLKKISSTYSSVIIGQERVKELLLGALYPLTKPENKKPIVLLFYGPTGVGKTETAKYLSELLGETLFRKQFSMFHSSDFSSYLFGGNHAQNCFAKELLERESNIILLDEFDKSHPVFHSAFYQLFDEGVFEDKNYNVVLEKAIIICTSNYRSEDDIKRNLGAPLYSRFDAVIQFTPLKNEAIIKIINNQFNAQYERLTEHEKKLIDATDLKSKILSKAASMDNVRQIRKLIKESMSIILVKHLIECHSDI